MVITVNNNVLYLKFVKRVNLKCFHHTFKKKRHCQVMDILISLIMVNISQGTHIPKHLEYLKYT